KPKNGTVEQHSWHSYLPTEAALLPPQSGIVLQELITNPPLDSFLSKGSGRMGGGCEYEPDR
ncbi:MAG: hypothetical protein VXW13_03215, partial [SAR324 cluster bacterium]|nr:hypothetical protein [SAR324 cluster bacterium]